MSILAAGQQLGPGSLYFVLIWTALALATAWMLGAFRWRSIEGPPRLPAGRAVAPAVAVLGLAIASWFGTQLAWGAYRGIEARRTGTTIETDPAKMSPNELVFLSTVPSVAGLLAIVIGLRRHPDLSRRLGTSPWRIPSGVLIGLIGAFVVIPIVIWTGVFAEAFYRAWNIQHPPEHDLLRIFKHADRRLAMLTTLAAVVVAPLFEETIFRGLLQSIVTRFTHPWVGVTAATVLFTLVHPKWTWPPIFVLSLCLGYIYERTGNLWASMTLHAAFNALSVIQYRSMG